MKAYAENIRNMIQNAADNQSKLLTVINELFTYVNDKRTNKKVIRVNPKLTEESLQKAVEKTRRLIIDLYIKCENDYVNGVKIYEAIVESKILSTTEKQIENLKKEANKIITETKDIRQARIDKLDKKPDKKPDKQPVLAIEDEKVDIPVISEEDMKKYKKQTVDVRKAEAEEPESQEVGSSVEGYDDFVKYISNKNTYNWKLADILIKNGITDPKTGNGFYIRKVKGSDKQIAMMHGSNKTVDKTYLTELLRQKYNEGLIKNYLN
jgi:hypothetical protein